MKFLPKSLMARLIVYFLLLALVTVSSATYFAFTQASKTLEEAMLARLEAVVDLKETELNRWVDEQRQNIVLMSQLPSVKAHTEVLLGPDAEREGSRLAYRNLTGDFQAIISSYPNIKELFVLRKGDGEVIVSTNKENEGKVRVQKTYFQKGQEEAYVQSIYNSSTTQSPILTIATPLHDADGTLLGVLAAHIDLDSVEEIIQNQGNLDQEANIEIYLLVKEPTLLVSTHPNAITSSDLPSSAGIDRALQGKDGGDYYLNHEDIPVLGAYRWVQDQNLALVAELSHWEAFAPARQLAMTVSLIGLASITGLSIGVYFLAHQIGRPIQNLVTTTRAITAGDLSQQASESDITELDELAKTFNSMTHQLQQTLVHLEQRVQERTSELAQVNEMLQQDIQQRKAMEKALRESQQFIEKIATSTPSFIYIYDLRDEKIIYTNRKIGEVFGYSEEDLESSDKPFLPHPFIHPDDLALISPHLGKIRQAKDHEVMEIEYRIQHKNGKWHWLYSRDIVFHRDEAGKVTQYLSNVQDITKRKRSEEAIQEAHDELARRVSELAILNYIIQTVATITDLQMALQEVIKTLSQLFEAKHTSVALLSEDKKILEIIADYTNFSNEEERLNKTDIIGMELIVENHPNTIEVIETKQPVILNNAQNNPDTEAIHDLMRLRGTHCLMIVPLLARGEVIGTIGIDSNQPHRNFTDNDIELAKTIAGQLAGAVEISHLFDKEQQQRKAAQQRSTELITLNIIMQTVSTVTNLQDTLELVTKMMAELFEVQRCGIALLNESKTTLTLVTDYVSEGSTNGSEATLSPTTSIGTKIPLKNNPSSTQVVETGKPLVIPQAQTSPLTKPIHHILRERNAQTLVILPLLARGEVIGTIGLDIAQPEREFTANDLNLGQTIAGQIAGAIENARLFDQEQRQRQIAESLREVATILSSSLDQKTVLDKIMEQLGKVIDYDSGAVFLHLDGNLILAGGAGIEDAYIGYTIDLQHNTPEAQVFRQQDPRIISDVREDPDWQVWTDDDPVRAWIGTPLLVRRESIGILTADSFEIGTYGQEDIQILQTFASHAAIAIQNAQLYQTIRHEKQLFETMLTSSPVAIVTLNLASQIVSWNPAAERLFGYTQEEVIGCNINEIVTAPQTQAEAINYTQQVAQGQPIQLMTQRNRKDGTAVEVELLAVPVIVDEKPVVILTLYHDLTEIKQAEEALRQKNQDLGKALADLKAAQEELIQSEKMAALGQLVAGVAHEINTPLGAIRAAIENISDSLNESSRKLPKLLQNLSSEKQDLFFSILDRAAENELKLSSREERKHRRRLRRMLENDYDIAQAATLADILTDIGIYNQIEFLQPLLQEEQAISIMEVAYKLARQKKNSDNITLAVERASKIVFALKNYTRDDQADRLRETNLSVMLETVLTMYYNQIKQGVEVIKKFADVPTIFCYPDGLTQVWTNLIHNALQAMEQKGTLEITISQTPCPPPLQEDKLSAPQWIDALKKGCRYIVVSITDSGPGIPDDIKDKIFQPFFTTKPPGEGSGLGLDIARRVIERHEGLIRFESQPGRTTFRVWLPLLNSNDDS